MLSTLRAEFGDIDIYLFDQLLKGRIAPGMTVFDAGCGSGRNLVYLLKQGLTIYACDADPAAVDHVRRLATKLVPGFPGGNILNEPVEATSFPDALADVVLSSAVLHFARTDEQFRAMLHGTWRVLKPDGMLFCRLASSIGMESRLTRAHGRRFLLPDGSERYLVDEAMLVQLTDELGGRMLDPLKTTVVQNQRCMTTWVVQNLG